jgi:hypothetical protein
MVRNIPRIGILGVPHVPANVGPTYVRGGAHPFPV